MADTPIAFRGAATTATQTGATTSITCTSAAVAGDYLLVFASTNYQSSMAINTPPAGLSAWTSAVAASNGSTTRFAAWIAQLTTSGAKTVSVTNATGSSNLDLIAQVLDPSGGTITIDGVAPMNSDSSSPFTHASISPAGTADLLFCGNGQVQFSGTTSYGAAPAGMTQLATVYANANCGLQVCYQQLTAAGATGTRNQTSTPTTVSSSSGGMFALRNDAVVAPSGPEPGRYLLVA